MTDTSNGELVELQTEIGEASAALQAFAQGPARRAADEVAASFERSGQRIARALGRAAFDGENAFKRMAKTILEEIAKVALERVFAPRAGDGGQKPVVQGAVGAPVAVHFHMSGGDANAVARHQGQIAASIARAVAYGRRNL